MNGIEALLVVRPATTTDARDRLAADLAALGCVGEVIDGAHLGRPGHVVARVAGEGEDVIVLATDEDADVSFELLPMEGVAERLGTDTLLSNGDVELDGVALTWPVASSPGAQPTAVGVARRSDLMLSVDASVDGVRLAEASVDDRILVARLEPDDEEPDGGVGEALASAKGVAVVLWRRDPFSGFQLLRRGRPVEGHVWEPAWTPFEPDGCPADLREAVLELRSLLAPREADAAEVGRRLGLEPPDVVTLRAMLRRPAMDAPALVRLLGLPDVTADVLAGRVRVEDLPGAVVHEPRPMRSVLKDSLKASPHDPHWVRAIDDGMRELRPWYVLSSVAFLVLCGWGVARWLDGGSAFWGVVATVAGLGQLVDLAVRWSLKRRRTPR